MSSDEYKRKAAETAAFLNARITRVPRTGWIVGTGLGDAAGPLHITTAFDYRSVPHFPVATVPSHAGRLLFGHSQDRPVMVMQGRLHLYEGYSPAEVTFPVRVMQEMGVRRLIVTNAAGGLNPSFRTGDLMVITDHINLTGENPLAGYNVAAWGPRFPDMTRAYSRKMITLAEAAARSTRIPVRKGVYVGLKGPSLETPAETRLLRALGADAAGFSTVPEVIAAVHGGMEVFGLSIITNVNDPDHPIPATLEEIVAVARQAAPSLEMILSDIMGQLDD